MIRDIVRAVLVLVVLAVSLELLQIHREAATHLPVAAGGPQVQADPRGWQPAPPAWQPAYAPAPPERPLRRVAGSVVDLADSVLGVIR